MMLRVLVLINIVVLASACAPIAYKPGPNIQEPFLSKDAFFTADGARLPLYRWIGTASPQAVIIALHGFNDYGRFFNDAASFLNT
ncbi:MAG: alpha/beta hydrolase, partial [Gammaproteobacteria bacterium]|nr:alpha/beta hydrolase [Gammaproteobacteria bacterium]